MLIMLVVVALVIGALYFVKERQINAAIAMGKSMAPPPDTVTTVVVQPQSWQPVLSAVGSLQSRQWRDRKHRPRWYRLRSRLGIGHSREKGRAPRHNSTRRRRRRNSGPRRHGSTSPRSTWSGSAIWSQRRLSPRPTWTSPRVNSARHKQPWRK